MTINALDLWISPSHSSPLFAGVTVDVDQWVSSSIGSPLYVKISATAARWTITGTPDLSPDCTTPDTGEPAGTFQSQSYWTWTAGESTYYLWWGGAFDSFWYITPSLGGKPLVDPYFKSLEFKLTPDGQYNAANGGAGIVTVAEYAPPVVGVITNLLLGSTVEACRILSSRIVRGPI